MRMKNMFRTILPLILLVEFMGGTAAALWRIGYHHGGGSIWPLYSEAWMSAAWP